MDHLLIFFIGNGYSSNVKVRIVRKHICGAESFIMRRKDVHRNGPVAQPGRALPLH